MEPISECDLPALLSLLGQGDLLRAAAEYCNTGKLPKWLTETEEVSKPHGTLRDATVMFNTPQYTVIFSGENVTPNGRLLLSNAYINNLIDRPLTPRNTHNSRVLCQGVTILSA